MVKSVIKKFGYEWSFHTDAWTAKAGRFTLITWPFGHIYQCVIEINYDHRIDGKLYTDSDLRICYSGQKTRDDAMRKAIAGMKNLRPKSPEEVFAKCYTNYKSLYRTRLDVINHLFFTIGNGYSWFDGSIINTAEERIFSGPRASEEDWLIRARELEELHTPIGPLPDDGQDYQFYPAVSGYSKVFIVPDDVTDEWLQVAYEAAKLLATRSGLPAVTQERPNFILMAMEEKFGGAPFRTPKNAAPKYTDEDKKRQKKNRRIGKKLMKDLERRFKGRLVI